MILLRRHFGNVLQCACDICCITNRLWLPPNLCDRLGYRLSRDAHTLLQCAVIRTDAGLLSTITTQKGRLADIIEPDFGLLDELLRLQVLSRRQYNKIRSGDKAAEERNDALLDLLTTEDQCDKFMKALQRTQQQHIFNFVTQSGGLKHSNMVTH